MTCANLRITQQRSKFLLLYNNAAGQYNPRMDYDAILKNSGNQNKTLDSYGNIPD